MTAVAAGLVDRVARKAPREMDTTGDQGRRRSGKYPVPYMCCSATVPGQLFIHPQSSVFDHDPTKVGRGGWLCLVVGGGGGVEEGLCLSEVVGNVAGPASIHVTGFDCDAPPTHTHNTTTRRGTPFSLTPAARVPCISRSGHSKAPVHARRHSH
jgi:hypothetical protein